MAKVQVLSFVLCPVNFTQSSSISLLDKQYCFKIAARRLITPTNIEFAQHITLTNADFRFISSERLQGAGIDWCPMSIEPEVKKTPAAILVASIFAQSADEEAILLVASSDHFIPDTIEFHRVIGVGLHQLENGQMVTLCKCCSRVATY